MGNKTLLNIGAIGAVVGMVVLWYIFTGIGVRNQEATLRANFTAIQTGNKVDYDAMWKIINQTSQVPTQYSKDFTEAYSKILQSSGGTDQNAVRNLFAVATGMKVPQLDSSLYRKVQDVIESQRTKFANAQKSQLAIKAEHDILRTTWPGSLFVGNLPPLVVQVVTSTRTENAFETGKDNDVNLFNKGD